VAVITNAFVIAITSDYIRSDHNRQCPTVSLFSTHSYYTFGLLSIDHKQPVLIIQVLGNKKKSNLMSVLLNLSGLVHTRGH